MTYPALIFLGLLLWSFIWPKEKLVYLLFGSAAFGSLAILPPELVGGVNLLPASAAALLLVARYFLDKRFLVSLPEAALRLDRLGLLAAFMGVAVISALFFPKLFAGQVIVAPMRGLIGPLQPSMANTTQLAYLIVSCLAAFVFHHSGSDRRFVQHCLRAFVIGGGILALSGIADLALGSASTVLMAPFKTADYDMLEGSQVLGFRRIDGFMTEASAYGSVCILFAAVTLFASPLLATTREKFVARVVALSLVGCAIISTSSTAYVGIAALGMIYVANFARRALDGFTPGRARAMRFLLIGELGFCYLALAAVAVVAMFAPDLFLTPISFVEELIFKKSQGGSYMDRMNWNTLAMDALAKTGWLGVGVGGARASNWMVAVLSNTGIVGGALMFSFLAIQLLKPAPRGAPDAREFLVIAKATLVVFLVMAGLAGTAPDFGVTVGAMFGLIVATTPQKLRSRVLVRRAPKTIRRAPKPVPAQMARPAPTPAVKPMRKAGRMLRNVVRRQPRRLQRRPSRV
jgi:hypothetical protein